MIEEKKLKDGVYYWIKIKGYSHIIAEYDKERNCFWLIANKRGKTLNEIDCVIEEIKKPIK